MAVQQDNSPAFLMMWASPSSRAKAFSTWNRASMQPTTATFFLGGLFRTPLLPKRFL